MSVPSGKAASRAALKSLTASYRDFKRRAAGLDVVALNEAMEVTATRFKLDAAAVSKLFREFLRVETDRLRQETAAMELALVLIRAERKAKEH